MKDIDIIQEALKKLEDADYAGFFREMDKINIPKNKKNVYNELQDEFINGKIEHQYNSRLQTFTEKIKTHIIESNPQKNIQNNSSNQQEVNQNQLEIEDDKPTPTTETPKKDFPKVSKQTVEAETEDEEIKWESIAMSIKEKKAIIILGKGVTCNYFNKDNEFELYNKINNKYNAVKFFQEDGLFVLKPAADRRVIENALKEFYAQDFSVNRKTQKKNKTLEKIAEIPFHLFINLAPDITLNKVFDNKEFRYRGRSYKPNPESSTSAFIEEPSPEYPTIYNLFGNVARDNQYFCIDHFDLFTYLETFAQVREDDKQSDSENKSIKSFLNIKKIETVVFLGCDLNKWYFQLILYLLKIQKIVRKNENIGKINAIATPNLKPEFQEIYRNKFQINFNKYTVDNFVNILYKQFKQEDLRTPNSADQHIEILRDKWLEKIQKSFTEHNILEVFKDIEDNPNLEYSKLTLSQVKDDLTGNSKNTSYINKLKEFINKIETKS